MQDYRLKQILVALAAMIFSLIFILLALVLPISKHSYVKEDKKPQSKFDKFSEGMKKGF